MEILLENLESICRRETVIAEREASVTRREWEVHKDEANLVGQRQEIGRRLQMLVEQTEASRQEREALDSRRTTLEQEEAALKEKARQAEEMLAAVRREEAASQEKARQAEERLAAARMLQRWGAQRIADWAGKAKSALVPLGFSPIRVDAMVTPFADASPVLNSVADALPMLDSAAECLRHLNEVLNAQLKSEGRELSRVVAEHILVCLRSHDPTISLAPIVAGPVPAAEESARESVQKVVEIVVTRFVWNPED